MSETKTIEEIKTRVDKYKSLCQSVFGSGGGKELLSEMERIYCDDKLYDDSDRKMVYNVAIRDFILELKHHVKEK